MWVENCIGYRPLCGGDEEDERGGGRGGHRGTAARTHYVLACLTGWYSDESCESCGQEAREGLGREMEDSRERKTEKVGSVRPWRRGEGAAYGVWGS